MENFFTINLRGEGGGGRGGALIRDPRVEIYFRNLLILFFVENPKRKVFGQTRNDFFYVDWCYIFKYKTNNPIAQTVYTAQITY